MALAPAPRRILGLVLSAAGLATVVIGGLQAADLRSRLGPMRLLIGPSAIVASADGTVLVGSAGLSKLHIYEASGRPLRAWHIETKGQPFHLALPAADRIAIAPADAGTLLEYTLEGELLSSREDRGAWERLAPGDPLVFEADSGARYEIDGGQVVRSQAGRRDVLADGFASHAELTLRIVRVVAMLILGACALLGGVLITATRKASASGRGSALPSRD